jgi:hypothetical protein
VAIVAAALDGSSSPTVGLPRGQDQDWRSRCIAWVSWNSVGEVEVTAASSERCRGRAAAQRRGESKAMECVEGGDEQVLSSGSADCPVAQMAEPMERTMMGPPPPTALVAT